MNWFASKPEKPKAEAELPLERTFEREFPADYQGYAYTWDVDNTYLRTDIHNLMAMLTLPLETAIDKKPFPGVPELLQEIRRGPGPDSRETPLFFVSASPRQLRGVLEKRMLLDGIQQDGFTLRRWGTLARQDALSPRKLVRKLKDPLTYKLTALLLNRRDLPPGVREFLFGDDTEMDVLIYGLYAEILAGRLRGEELAGAIARSSKADPSFVLELSDDLVKSDVVEGIFIHLASGRPASALRSLYALDRIKTFEDYSQAARDLESLGQISRAGLDKVSQAVEAAR